MFYIFKKSNKKNNKLYKQTFTDKFLTTGQ